MRRNKRGVRVLCLLAWLATASVGHGITQRAWATPAFKPQPPAAAPFRRPPTSPLGLRIAPLEPATAQALKLAGGLRVEHATGAAYVSGLRGEDVITELNGKPVTDPDAFWDALAAANWCATLRVLRNGGALTIELSPADGSN
jgi:S1-C subfamily serine protease